MEMKMSHSDWKRGVLDSLKEAYTDAGSAPDGSLEPEDAWMMGLAYGIEFTAREMFFRGFITRKDGREILKHTGGTITDADEWRDSD
jgi:hypothetical protein